MRWFVSKENMISDTKVALSKDDFHYLSRVRRLKQGEKLELIIGGDLCRTVEISDLSHGELIVTVISESKVDVSVPADITLIQGLPKLDKFSEILNGCTQVGVSSFYPVEMQRCIVSYTDKQKSKKHERWRDVIHAASLQSYQVREPVLSPVLSWTHFFSDFDASMYDLLLVAWEDEAGTTLKRVLQSKKVENPKIALVIGPEGGLAQSEVEELQRKGFVSVSLGGTILRTEVAGLVGCSQIMYHFS
jgi:16S rRNA (uracil1498-N3)-methyltransferase